MKSENKKFGDIFNVSFICFCVICLAVFFGVPRLMKDSDEHKARIAQMSEQLDKEKAAAAAESERRVAALEENVKRLMAMAPCASGDSEPKHDGQKDK